MLDSATISLIWKGVLETLIMVFGGTGIGYLIGLPMGIALTVTDKNGIHPNKAVYSVLDFICNMVRSIPFIILMILMIPITRAIVGKSYGTAATIVPLVACCAPYIGRVVESSLKEVDAGVIEAARSMGASNWDIIFKVLLVEARTSLIINATITTGAVLGYTAMAGTIGGGGLGAIAITYGYHRWNTTIMIITVILIMVLFQIIQNVGMKIANSVDHRK